MFEAFIRDALIVVGVGTVLLVLFTIIMIVTWPRKRK